VNNFDSASGRRAADLEQVKSIGEKLLVMTQLAEQSTFTSIYTPARSISKADPVEQ
jgi:hypothetical protein